MCEHNSETGETCHTPPIKSTSAESSGDQWSILDNVDEETLKKLILEFELELQHELPELNGSLQLTVNVGEDEDPDRWLKWFSGPMYLNRQNG